MLQRMPRDLYVALGVSHRESPTGIRAAFRDLSRRFHPDRVGPSGAPGFREIARAFGVLSDAGARARYDVAWEAREDGEGSRADAAPDEEDRDLTLLDASSVRPGIEPLVARLARNFDGVGVAKGERAERLDLLLHLDPEDARRGVVVRLGVPALARCPSCAGLGATLPVPCALCLGSGFVETTRTLRIPIPQRATEDAELLVPLDALGIQNLYACVHLTMERHAI